MVFPTIPPPEILIPMSIMGLVILIWLVKKMCTLWAIPKEYSRSPLRPSDGSDGLSAAHGADVSYFPSYRASDKGGIPVGGLGRDGRGSYRSKTLDEDDSNR